MKNNYIIDNSYRKLKIVSILLLLITLFSFYYFCSILENNSNWVMILGYISLILLGVQIFILLKAGYKLSSFQILFILSLYIFMFGRIILVGVLGINEIYSERFFREVLGSTKINNHILMLTSVFVLCCIQAIVSGLILNKRDDLFSKKYLYEFPDYILFKTGLWVLIIGLPCHILYSVKIISWTQTSSSYNEIQDISGLLDDFANFLVPGVMCIIFSNYLDKKKILRLCIFLFVYLLCVMILTGDRRYQSAVIISVILAIIYRYSIKFSWKSIIIVACIIIMLNLFTTIREIRNNNLVSLESFFSEYSKSIFTFKSNFISQTLYEFGVSIYSVAYVISAIPSVTGFRYGMTFLRAILLIIPAGFLYQDWDFVKFAGISSIAEDYSGSAIGGAMLSDLYGNFGFLGGIIASFIIGLCFAQIFRIRKGKQYQLENVRYFVLFYSLIHLARASFSEVFRTALWSLFIVYLIYWILGGYRYVNKSSI